MTRSVGTRHGSLTPERVNPSTSSPSPAQVGLRKGVRHGAGSACQDSALTTITTQAIGLPSGEQFPALGQGTWEMGDDPAHRAEELHALRLGIDLGLTLIDTAELYGDGAAEELVAEAIDGRRDDVFLVSKVSRENRGALDLALDHDDLKLLDEEFPPPAGPQPLDTG
jgi:hypothetical protein